MLNSKTGIQKLHTINRRMFIVSVAKIVIFTGTVAHPMVTEATRIARIRGIPIERTHSSSVSALKRCLEGFIESEATS